MVVNSRGESKREKWKLWKRMCREGKSRWKVVEMQRHSEQGSQMLLLATCVETLKRTATAGVVGGKHLFHLFFSVTIPSLSPLARHLS